MGASARPGRDDEEDFVLRRGATGFGRPFLNGRVAQGFCCCCCLDILGAYVGAYVGGAVGSGIGYRRLRRSGGRAPKYRWIILWSLLAIGLLTLDQFVCYVIRPDWLPDMSPPIPLGGWVKAVSVGIWVLGINPGLCFLLARRFSFRLLGISLLCSVLGMLVGYAIGCVIMGGSLGLDDLL